MSLSFANFTIQETANTRQSTAGAKRGQSYKARFRRFVADKNKENERIETLFQLSNKLFDETQLSSVQYGGIQIVSPDGVPYIAVVDRDNGTFLKQSDKAVAAGNKKGTAFKSTILEQALVAQGIINTDDALLGKSQKLDLTKVAEYVTIGEGAKAISAIAVYQIDKDSNTDAVDEDEEEGTVDSEIDGPIAGPENAVSPSMDDDDF